MSRFKELAKSSASVLASQVGMAIIAIVFVGYFAHILSAQEMALFAYISMLSVWVQTLGGFGLNTIAIKKVAMLNAKNDIDGVKKLVSGAVLYRFVGMGALTLLLLGFSKFLGNISFGKDYDLRLLQYVIIISFLASCYASLTGILQALQLFQFRSVLNVAMSLGQRIGGLLGFFYFGIYGFFTGYLFISVVGTIWTLYDIRHYLTWQIPSFKKLVYDSRGYFGLDILRGTLVQLDQPVVAFFLGAEILAGYYVAKRFYDNAYAIVSAIILPAGVKFGEVKIEGDRSLQDYYTKLIGLCVVLFIPCGCFLAGISKPLMAIYAGPKYQTFATVAVIFGFALTCAALWMMLREAALRLLPIRQMYFQYIVSSFVTLLGYIVLLPLCGAIGAPVAILLGYCAGILPVAAQLRHLHNLNFPLHDAAKASVCGLIIITAIIPILMIKNYLLQIFLYSILSTIIFCIFIFVAGPVSFRGLASYVMPAKKVIDIKGGQ